MIGLQRLNSDLWKIKNSHMLLSIFKALFLIYKELIIWLLIIIQIKQKVLRKELGFKSFKILKNNKFLNFLKITLMKKFKINKIRI